MTARPGHRQGAELGADAGWPGSQAPAGSPPGTSEAFIAVLSSTCKEKLAYWMAGVNDGRADGRDACHLLGR